MTEAEREFLSLIIGHRVRELRKRKGLSQHELANGIGSQSMISLIESGRQLPLPDVLHALANRLNDSVLHNYAENLDSGTVSSFSISLNNQDDLMDILVNHRGRWQPAHERIASQLCHHYYYTRDFQQVEDLCKIIINHAQRDSLLAEAYFYLGSSLLQMNKFEDAEKWLRKSETYIEALPDGLRGRLFYNIGYAYSYLDIQVLALWYASQAVDTFHRLNDFQNHGKALGLLGVVQTRLNRLQEAKYSLSTAYDILSRWGFSPTDQSRILITLAEVCFILGQYDEAEHNASLALNQMSDTDYLCIADVYHIHAQLAIKNGQRDVALRYITQGLDAAMTTHELHSLTHLYLLHVQVLDDINDKIKAARNAFELTKGTNHHILNALAAECLASLIEQASDSDEDPKVYMQAALDSYRTYVHKNSMFTNLIDNLPIYDSYSEKTSGDSVEIVEK